MKKTFLNKLKLLSLTALIAGFSVSANAALTVGETAPDFNAKTVAGADFKLSEQKGKIVVLEWTNHNCPFVVKHYDSKNMQGLQEKYTAKDVVWVSINSSAEGKEGYLANAEEAKKIIDEKGNKASHFIVDAAGTIGKQYHASTTPHMYVIDKEGNLAYQGAIDSIPSASKEDVTKADNYVANAVDELLAGKPVSKPNTTSYGCSVKY